MASQTAGSSCCGRVVTAHDPLQFRETRRPCRSSNRPCTNRRRGAPGPGRRRSGSAMYLASRMMRRPCRRGCRVFPGTRPCRGESASRRGPACGPVRKETRHRQSAVESRARCRWRPTFGFAAVDIGDGDEMRQQRARRRRTARNTSGFPASSSPAPRPAARESRRRTGRKRQPGTRPAR